MPAHVTLHLYASSLLQKELLACMLLVYLIGANTPIR
jgi:hypothetical protein